MAEGFLSSGGRGNISGNISDSGLYTPVTWANGSDANIVSMIEQAAVDKTIVTCYWAIGDERNVDLTAMPATSGTVTVSETHAAQTVTLVLMNEGYSVDGVDNSNVNFVVGLKNCLNETGYMNKTETNSTGWRDSARRGWCNSIFYASFPDTLKPIFKLFNTITALTANNSTYIDITKDRFSLFAEKEIFGSKTRCVDSEAAKLNKITWYATAANRKKQVNGSNDYWWERSPDYSSTGCFCHVIEYGSAKYMFANRKEGLAPFGCI